MFRPSSGNGSVANCKGSYVNGTHNNSENNITLTNIWPHTKTQNRKAEEKGESNIVRLKIASIHVVTLCKLEPENRCLRMAECAETGNTFI
jgi:hypothetical protein